MRAAPGKSLDSQIGSGSEAAEFEFIAEWLDNRIIEPGAEVRCTTGDIAYRERLGGMLSFTTAALPDSLPYSHDDLRLSSCGWSLLEALISPPIVQADRLPATTSSPTCSLMQTNSTENLRESIPDPALSKASARRLNFWTIRDL
jgi:hypothetical protein